MSQRVANRCLIDLVVVKNSTALRHSYYSQYLLSYPLYVKYRATIISKSSRFVSSRILLRQRTSSLWSSGRHRRLLLIIQQLQRVAHNSSTTRKLRIATATASLGLWGFSEHRTTRTSSEKKIAPSENIVRVLPATTVKTTASSTSTSYTSSTMTATTTSSSDTDDVNNDDKNNADQKNTTASTRSSTDDDDDDDKKNSEDNDGQKKTSSSPPSNSSNATSSDADVDALAKAVEEKVHVSANIVSPKEEEEEVEAEKDDDEISIDDIPECYKKAAKWISNAKRIIVVSGAGVSVSAGIPDFRSPGTGLYDNLAKYNLPYPEAVFDVGFYAGNPKPFVALASEIWPNTGKHYPTITHSFIALLASHNKLLRNYTQNIDGLEHMAKVSPEHLIECHGHFRSGSCIQCNNAAKSIDEVKRTIINKQIPVCRHCKSNNNYVKPDIVFFGENLPAKFHNHLRQDTINADLCIVLGTSLAVAPVSHIPHMVNKNCKRILINREHVGNIGFDPSGPKYHSIHASPKDIFVPGNCDDSIKLIARILGWKQELITKHKAACCNTTTKDDNDNK